MTYDPIGPGTPAWRSWDLAIEAWQAGNKKAYHNYRQYMVECLRRADTEQAIIDLWVSGLKAAREFPQ